jgi:hypothetical protein
MTIDDLFLEQQLEKMNKLDTAWARFQSEAREMRQAESTGLLARTRGGLASTLVRAGVRLDRRAGERALTPTAR